MISKGVNDKMPEARQKLLRIGQILKQNNPTNILIEPSWKVSTVIQASFTNIEDVRKVIKTLKEEDLGISIVVSGLVDEIKDLLDELDIHMHTVHLSLGTFGKKDLLPSEDILEITTMCGHHCISPQSVKYYLELIKQQKISIQKAAEKLTKPCVCGIFNTSRAVKILTRMSK